MSILDKNFHYVLVGKSTLAFILGLGLLKVDKRVLVIDDSRLSFGGLYAQNLGSLEKNVFEVLGQDENYTPLINIEEYLTLAPQRFIVSKRQLFLGRSPWQNFVEINRKFPEIFGQAGLDEVSLLLSDEKSRVEFNDMFQAMVFRIASSIARVDGADKLNFKLFLNHCPEAFQKLFTTFFENVRRLIHDEGSLSQELSGVVYLFRSFYQQLMGLEANDTELFHLFLSMLSPRYELNEKQLSEDLLELFMEHGGQFKKTVVREWKFHKHAPWSIELASFDGIIHPQKINFFGSALEKLPFRAHKQLKQFRGLNLFWEFSSARLKGLVGQRLVGTQLDKLGTDSPWWMADFTKNGVNITVPVAYTKGFKTSFVQESLTKAMFKVLRPWIGEVSSSDINERVELGPELWIEPEFGGDIHDFNIKLLDVSVPGHASALSHVHYYGPLNTGPLGPLSGLVSLKEAHTFA